MTQQLPPALTLWQPWASAIFQHGKDVENRSWPTNHRGLLFIHAGKHWDNYAWFPQGHRPGPRDHYPAGVLLGVVRLVDVVRDARSPWAQPDLWHWLLTEPRLLAEPIPAVGHQSLWQPVIPEADRRRVAAAAAAKRGRGTAR